MIMLSLWFVWTDIHCKFTRTHGHYNSLLPLIITFAGASIFDQPSFNTHIQPQKMVKVSIIVPTWIKARWAELHKLRPQQQYKYTIHPILQRANISAEEFKKCWFSLERRLSNDELFSLFKDSGFSPSHGEVNGRLSFVKMVLQRYKGIFILGGVFYVHMTPIPLHLLFA